jgi:2-oxoglutarate dehydrogenase E2 component (dihydrolipoamide succinyltransferase)
MKEEIKVPPLGESISEATVSALLKQAGAQVKMDDELLELATDKVNQVLYAPQGGTFVPAVKEDDVVKIGQVIGYIDTKGVGTATQEKPPEKQEAKPSKVEEKRASVSVEQVPVAVVTSSKGPASRESIGDYLSELKAPIQPVETAVKASATPAMQTAFVPATGETRHKMSKIRKIIATRLVEVQNSTAMLTTFNEVDLTEVMALREKYKDTFAKSYGTRLGFMSFFVKASVSALKAFPAVNTYIDGEDLVQRHYYAIGIAVGGEKGLVVPVVRDCDKLSFSQIEGAIATYAQKIKDGKLSADDLYGGGFTITNGGVYGSLLSTPILNPKQCAILGMHKISKRAVVIGDKIEIRQMMYLALSYDHRIIDGKEAVSFLVHIKNCLEDPSRMLLEV